MTTATAGETDNKYDDGENYRDLSGTHAIVLLASISIVALCGIVYQLIIGTVSSYLLGNSVYQFSITIGFFMFAMGIGSYISKFIGGNLIARFIQVEVALALIGGICSLALFFAFPYAPFLYQVVMFFFILSIGALVGLEIPLLTRILADGSGTRRSIANVMSLDYIGALVGSVAFPLMLLPEPRPRPRFLRNRAHQHLRCPVECHLSAPVSHQAQPADGAGFSAFSCCSPFWSSSQHG